MSIHIAIPEPTSSDTAYNQRSLPPYIQALQSAGATPIVIPLHERQDRVARLLATVQGVLLPGSGFDIDPQTYGAARLPACNPPDPARAAVDELLLQDAFNLHKPILAICYGLQALNVWRNGTLLQDIPTQVHTSINHAPGRTVSDAHPLVLTPGSLLARLAAASMPSTTQDRVPRPDLLGRESSTHPAPPAPVHSSNEALPAPQSPQHSAGDPTPAPAIQVNSSHHQALATPGDNLRVTALSPADHLIEAVELDSPDHYVLGVQWHPERTYTASPFSRAIFASFVQAASTWRPRPIEESLAQSHP